MVRKIFKITGIIILLLIIIATSFLLYIKKALPNVGAAPIISINPDSTMIERGAYLANHVTVCIDCHSHRDWSKFSGPIVAGSEGGGGERFDEQTGFPGTFFSPNITPTGLKNWTDGELFRAITTGVTKDNDALFPVMPYHEYSKLDSTDVISIIAYIRSLNPIKNNIPNRKINFPMNFIVNTIPEKAQPIHLSSLSSKIDYGKYLTTISGCELCHTKQENGKQAGALFAGGWNFHLPDGSIVTSPNITPDKETGLGNWTERDFITLFKERSTESGNIKSIKPGDFQTIMPWSMYGGMDTSDLKAIYSYLNNLKPVNNQVNIFTPSSLKN